MMRCSSGGAADRPLVAAIGSTFAMRCSVSMADGPANARDPVTASYRTQPNEKTSERWSTGRPCTCSGDM